MKLTIRKIVELFENFKQLNGREVVVRAEGQPDRTIFEAYRFGAAATWPIVKNLAVLKTQMENFNEARAAILESHGGADVMEDLEKREAFIKAVDELLDQEAEVTMSRIKLSALNLDVNPIQPGTLVGISDLIDES